jgi:hypothetical protein
MPEESVRLYRLRRGEVNGLRCLFGDASRKANGALFAACFTLNSMNETQQRNLRRAFLEACAAIGARDGTT